MIKVLLYLPAWQEIIVYCGPVSLHMLYFTCVTLNRLADYQIRRLYHEPQRTEDITINNKENEQELPKSCSLFNFVSKFLYKSPSKKKYEPISTSQIIILSDYVFLGDLSTSWINDLFSNLTVSLFKWYNPGLIRRALAEVPGGVRAGLRAGAIEHPRCSHWENPNSDEEVRNLIVLLVQHQCFPFMPCNPRTLKLHILYYLIRSGRVSLLSDETLYKAIPPSNKKISSYHVVLSHIPGNYVPEIRRLAIESGNPNMVSYILKLFQLDLKKSVE